MTPFGFDQGCELIMSGASLSSIRDSESRFIAMVEMKSSLISVHSFSMIEPEEELRHWENTNYVIYALSVPIWSEDPLMQNKKNGRCTTMPLEQAQQELF